jgi:hypothetical protein
MTDRLTALLAEAPGLERASRLVSARVPVLEAFEEILPERGLRPGSLVGVGGIGATSLALALVARASHDSWTAVVGMPELGLRAADELGVALDRLVVVPDPGRRWVDVLAAVVDAFDIVLARPRLGMRDARKVAGRVRERDAVFVSIGGFPGDDVSIEGTATSWHGIGSGHGRLASRTVDVTVSGRRAAARGRTATLWLPDPDGTITLAERTNVVRLAGSPDRASTGRP